jgi:hypothetical protein
MVKKILTQKPEIWLNPKSTCSEKIYTFIFPYGPMLKLCSVVVAIFDPWSTQKQNRTILHRTIQWTFQHRFLSNGTVVSEISLSCFDQQRVIFSSFIYCCTCSIWFFSSEKDRFYIILSFIQANKTLMVPTPRLRTGLFNKIVPQNKYNSI